jgi:hypothetical protein
VRLKIKKSDMEVAVVNSPLNSTQVHFLQSLRFVKTDKMMQELQQVVSDFYFQKMNAEADKWWEDNDMTHEKFNDLCDNINYRTPYK